MFKGLTSEPATELAAAVGFKPNAFDLFARFRRILDATAGTESATTWENLTTAIIDAARAYTEKHGRQPVQVIDGVGYLAKRKDTTGFAKNESDLKTIHIILS